MEATPVLPEVRDAALPVLRGCRVSLAGMIDD